MFKYFFQEENHSLAKTATVLAVASLASSVLGLFRDRLLTAEFGTGGVLDSYFMAFKIPDLLYNFLVLGTLSIVFIPIFTYYLTRDKKQEAWDLANSILNLSVLVMGTLSVILNLGAPFFVRLIAPGFEGSKYIDTVSLMRIISFSPLIFSISSIFTSILNSYKRFLVAACAPIAYNIGIIVGIKFFYPIMGVQGLGIGVLLGACAHLLIQLPQVVRSGYVYRAIIKSGEEMKKFWKMYLPKVFLIDVSQVSLFIGSVIASTQEKAVSVFNLAYNLDSLPLGLFAISLVVAVFPKLSEMYSKDDVEGFKAQFNRTALQILFLIVPISLILIFLRAQVVRLIYGSGRFDWEDTDLTLKMVSFFAISLFAQGLIPLLNRSFYARHNTKIPMIVGVCTMILDVALSLYLMNTRFGITGLSLAFSIASIFNLLVLSSILYFQLGGFGRTKFIHPLFKIAVASVIMIGVMQSVKNYFGIILTDVDTFFDVLGQILTAGSVGVAVYLSIGMALGLKEAEEFVRFTKLKVLKYYK